MSTEKVFRAQSSGLFFARADKAPVMDNVAPPFILILASTFFLWPLSAQAEGKNASVESYFQEFPIVLTASRLSQPLSESPSAMSVIDREMIQASGFRTVPELMRLVPGMYVGFADANRPVVSRHGATDEFSRRMQILIDGRSAYLPPFGGVNWADLPLQIEDIERIEVVRGPSSASHGTNSFYGVINIITRDALSQVGGSVSVTGGAASDVSARFGSAGEYFDFRLSAGYRSDQGIDNAVLNDHNATRLFNFRGNYHPNATDSFDVQLGSSNGVYGLGVAGRPEDAFRETGSKSNFLQVSWLHIWPAGDESKLTYSYTTRSSLDPELCIDSKICQGHAAVPIVQGFVRQEVYSQRNELELQNTLHTSKTNRLVWGGRVRRDYADYPLYLGRPYALSSWQVFAHDEWRITGKTVLNVGSMFEDNGMGNNNNSPRASLNYHVTPQHTVRAAISTATRSPAMGEVYMDAQNTLMGSAYVQPVAPLTPERIISKELGYLGVFHSLGITVDARAYVDQVTNMISVDKYPMLTSADSFKNLFSAEYRGVEATLKYHWNENRSFLLANYAHQHASVGFASYPTQYFSSIPDPYDPVGYSSVGDRIRRLYQTELLGQFSQIVPADSASLLLSHRFAGNWQFSAGYYWRNPVRVANVSADVARESTMRRLDLRLARTFRLDRGRNVELAMVVQNATQDNYTKYGVINEIANVPFARRGWLTATLNF
ncbi:MAG: TonB-dependent receptor [Sulfurimicrobium sp.]|nr:TonB-dependent receptor [Sulfurimicrobium sp.]